MPVVSYYLHGAHFYDGYPLQFVSERKDLIDAISINIFDNYPVVSLTSLKKFIMKNYKEGYVG